MPENRTNSIKSFRELEEIAIAFDSSVELARKENEEKRKRTEQVIRRQVQRRATESKEIIEAILLNSYPALYSVFNLKTEIDLKISFSPEDASVKGVTEKVQVLHYFSKEDFPSEDLYRRFIASAPDKDISIAIELLCNSICSEPKSILCRFLILDKGQTISDFSRFTLSYSKGYLDQESQLIKLYARLWKNFDKAINYFISLSQENDSK